MYGIPWPFQLISKHDLHEAAQIFCILLFTDYANPGKYIPQTLQYF